MHRRRRRILLLSARGQTGLPLRGLQRPAPTITWRYGYECSPIPSGRGPVLRSGVRREMGVPDDSLVFSGGTPQGPAGKQNEWQTQERLRMEARAIEVVADSEAATLPVSRPRFRRFLPVARFSRDRGPCRGYNGQLSRPAVAPRAWCSATDGNARVQLLARFVGLAAIDVGRSLP